jgi:hypothetical protein
MSERGLPYAQFSALNKVLKNVLVLGWIVVTHVQSESKHILLGKHWLLRMEGNPI